MRRGSQTAATGRKWLGGKGSTPLSSATLQLWAAPSMNTDKPLRGVGRLYPQHGGPLGPQGKGVWNPKETHLQTPFLRV